MIEDTIAKIEARLQSSGSLSPERRAELEDLLAELRREAAGLPREARTAPLDDDADAESAVRTLRESVAGFESTHPQLIEVVNRISNVLANMGI